MKLSMVIADDERLSLKGEEMLIKRAFPDIDIIGVAENGIDFKNMVESLNPDMAIVDVRMPGITGLEAIELLRNKGCRTHFIINTAYSDFDYVKTALNMKADAYLVKPSSREESIDAVSKMCKLIEKEKSNIEKSNQLENALQIAIPAYESELLLSIFTDRPNSKEFEIYCEVNKINYQYSCILTIMQLPSWKKMNIRMLNQILLNPLGKICHFLSTSNEQYMIVMLIIPEEVEHDKIKTWCGEIAQLISDELGRAVNSSLKYGLGNCYSGFDEMKLSYQESLREFVSQDNNMDFINESAEKKTKYIELARKYIAKNYTRDISLEDCAGEVGISAFYLSHIFRESTGQTFVENLSLIRISEAKRLCSDSMLSIDDITKRCGYSNKTYFYRVFKKATGLTIGEYRRKMQKEG